MSGKKFSSKGRSSLDKHKGATCVGAEELDCGDLTGA